MVIIRPSWFRLGSPAVFRVPRARLARQSFYVEVHPSMLAAIQAMQNKAGDQLNHLDYFPWKGPLP